MPLDRDAVGTVGAELIAAMDREVAATTRYCALLADKERAAAAWRVVQECRADVARVRERLTALMADGRV